MTNQSRLVRAEDAYAGRRGLPDAPLAEWAFKRFPPVQALRGNPDITRRGSVARGLDVKAEVNQGRWIARCPFCPSAQVVSPSDPRFLCAGADGCANASARGAFVRVVFPGDNAQAAIEAALLVRPAEYRNWIPGETLADLKRENVANGLDN